MDWDSNQLSFGLPVQNSFVLQQQSLGFPWVKDAHQPSPAKADPTPTSHLPRSSSFTTIAASLCNSSSSSKDFNADLFKNTCVQLLKMNSDDAPLVIFSATTTYLFQNTSKLRLRKVRNIHETPWGKPIFYHYPTPDFVQLLGGLLKICLQILHLDLESLERQWRTNPQGLSITAAPMPTPWLANKSFVVIIIT